MSIFILVLDQVSKILVAVNIPLHTIAWSFWGDFFQLVHVRNLGMAFSLGYRLPGIIKVVILILIPLSVLISITVFTIRTRDIPRIQRWLLAGIIGGGLGNQIDRIFRQDGVVDFLSFKFYGLLGMERWPTFNIADVGIVVSTTLFILLMLISEHRGHKH